MRDGKVRVRILVGARNWSPDWVLSDREEQPIAELSIRPGECARCQFDHGESPNRYLNAPGTERSAEPENPPASVDEGDVNREPHEECVNATARRQDERRVFRKVRSS